MSSPISLTNKPKRTLRGDIETRQDKKFEFNLELA
jgi:hypothetical protein